MQIASFTEQLASSSAVVKITAFFLVWIILWLPIAVPLAIAVKWRPLQPLATGQKLALVVSLYALAPFILWKLAAIESRSLAGYGAVWQLSMLGSLTLGLAIGALGVGLLLGLEYWFGWLKWQQVRWRQFAVGLLPVLLLALFISAIEELIFRGFLLNQLQQTHSLWTAAFVSSLIFALLHLVWEGREAIAQLPGLWLMGMVLVLARWIDHGSLGLACGLHAGWIWAMASLNAAELMRYSDRSPEWITGFKGNPLAGAMGLSLLLVTGITLLGLIGRI